MFEYQVSGFCSCLGLFQGSAEVHVPFFGGRFKLHLLKSSLTWWVVHSTCYVWFVDRSDRDIHGQNPFWIAFEIRFFLTSRSNFRWSKQIPIECSYPPVNHQLLPFGWFFSKVHFSGPCFSFQDSSKVIAISQWKKGLWCSSTLVIANSGYIGNNVKKSNFCSFCDSIWVKSPFIPHPDQQLEPINTHNWLFVYLCYLISSLHQVYIPWFFRGLTPQKSNIDTKNCHV